MLVPSRLRALMRALLSVLVISLISPLAPAQGPQVVHRWGGYVADSFLLDDGGVLKTWTAEDRRIRHRVGTTGAWTYQDLPAAVQGIIRRVHFLPTSGGQSIGFGVSSDGHVISTTDGGATWQIQYHIMEATGPADLQDIHFLTPTEGWMVSLKNVYRWDQGTSTWNLVTINSQYSFEPEYYALDVIALPNGERLGILCGEPGVVLRASGALGGPNYGLGTWTLVADVRLMCPSILSHLQPLGTITCCQSALCTTPFEPWDIELFRDGTRGAAMVGGLGQQCGMVFVSADVVLGGQGAGFVLEQHECTLNFAACINGTNHYCKVDECNQVSGFPSQPKYLCRMPSLYGLAILPDGSIAAAGYNGSVVRRPPGPPSPTHAWEDRSRWLTPFLQTGWDAGVMYPLFGVSAAAGYTLITGQGGYIRESIDGANTWSNAGVQGTPWRLKEVVFIDDARGYLVAQNGRISRSTDGGENWSHMPPGPGATLPFLNALAISATSLAGVAVGDTVMPGDGSALPLVVRNTKVDDPNTTWIPPTFLPLTAPDHRRLLDVTWATGSSFVAVGSGGLMLRSDDSGATWATIPGPPSQQFGTFEIAGVAFNGASSGIFVGRKHDAAGVLKGAPGRTTRVRGRTSLPPRRRDTHCA